MVPKTCWRFCRCPAANQGMSNVLMALRVKPTLICGEAKQDQLVKDIRRPPRQARGGGAWEGQCQSMTFSPLEKANLCVSMPELEFETKDKTKDSIVTHLELGILLKMLSSTASGDACGTPWACLNSAGDPLFCKHASRMRSPATFTYHAPICRAVRHAPIVYTHACAVFLRVSKMLYGTASGDQFGTPWARILLGFRCFASMPHGRVHRPCPPTTSLYYMSSYPPRAYLFLSMLLLCFYGFRRCCTAPPLGINLARLGLEFCWGSAVSQACLTDAFIGHVHLPCAYVPLSATRLLYARFCFVFTGFEDAVRHRLWGSIWHALGSNSAGVPLFRKHASRTRSSAMSTYYEPILYVQLSAMRLSIFVHAFAVFLRVSKMLYGTASGDQFGTPWARILLGFRCFASMPHGCVHRLCPPIRAYMSSYPPCAYLSMLLSMLLAVFFTGFEDAVRHRLWGSIWRAFCWGSAVSQACLTDAFIGYVRLYAPICPAISAMRLYIHILSMLLLCFLRVSKMLYGTASGDQFGTPWARILLGFRCFASMPHGCVHRPCPPAMHQKMSPCPPCAYYTHAFAVFLRVSKMLYGTASGD